VSEGSIWLERRLRSTPPELLQAMLAVIPSDGSEFRAAPDALAEGAMKLYRAAFHGLGAREDALSLLAADALFTHAFQAQAEMDPGNLAQFAERWGGSGQLGRVLGESHGS